MNTNESAPHPVARQEDPADRPPETRQYSSYPQPPPFDSPEWYKYIKTLEGGGGFRKSHPGC